MSWLMKLLNEATFDDSESSQIQASSPVSSGAEIKLPPGIPRLCKTPPFFYSPSEATGSVPGTSGSRCSPSYFADMSSVNSENSTPVEREVQRSLDRKRSFDSTFSDDDLSSSFSDILAGRRISPVRGSPLFSAESRSGSDQDSPPKKKRKRKIAEKFERQSGHEGKKKRRRQPETATDCVTQAMERTQTGSPFVHKKKRVASQKDQFRQFLAILAEFSELGRNEFGKDELASIAKDNEFSFKRFDEVRQKLNEEGYLLKTGKKDVYRFNNLDIE